MQGGRSIRGAFGLGLAMCCLWVAPAGAADAEPPGPPAAVAASPASTGVPDDAALQRAGARIGQVRFHRRDIFDTTIPEENKLLFRAANWLHVQTREDTVRAQLLFKPGDPYDPRLLRESERILRSSSYLRGAYIRPVAYADGRVDLEVVTEDVWTLTPEVTFNHKGGSSSSGFGLEDSNLLGMGNQLGVAYKRGVDRSATTLSYRDRQVAGSWWDLSTTYADTSDGRNMGFGLERPFYALDTRWAAGVKWRDEDRVDSLYDGGEVVRQFKAHERAAKLYGGWSAGLRDGGVIRWTAGLSFGEHRSSPVLPGAAAYGPEQRKFVYPWIGVEWIEDDFRETQNQDQIGRIEDVLLGWHLKAEFGWADESFGSDREAGLFSLSVTKGLQPSASQTLLLAAGAQGRVESDRLAASLFSATARYYLRQSPKRSFFMSLLADRSVRPDREQQLLLGGDNGLRGYPLRYQGGKGRWLFTVEERVFTDWYLWRLFRIGGAVFYDMGQAWGSTAAAPVSTGLLRDIGFGLRLGNSRTAFGNVVHIDAAFPLDGDPSIQRAQLILEVKRSF